MSQPQSQVVNEILKYLQAFFDPQTPPDTKKQMENALMHYKSLPESWEIGRYFLLNSTNDYALWFSASIYEVVVLKHWDSLSQERKKDHRVFLFQYLISKYQGLPPFVFKKICEVVVLIGKREWPHEDSAFLSNILNLFGNHETRELGVHLLKVISEEFSSDRHDIYYHRKQELKKHFIDASPRILNFLSTLLSQIFQENTTVDTQETLPPVHIPQQFIETTRLYKISTSPSSPSTPPHVSPSTSPVHSFFPSQPRMDPKVQRLASLIFDTLLHLVGWLPLNSLLSLELIDTLMKYVRLCEGTSNFISSPNSSPTLQGWRGGVLSGQSLLCLIEILSRNFIPPEFEPFLTLTFFQIFALLQYFAISPASISKLDSEYLSKITQFISIFLNNHLKRIESHHAFPILPFLQSLVHYTLSQPTSDDYLSSLSICQFFLEYLHTTYAESISPSPNAAPENPLNKYRDLLVAFGSELLRRMQFRYNYSRLSELQDESDFEDYFSERDEDQEEENSHEESDFDKHFTNSLEVLALIVDLYPESFNHFIIPNFRTAYEAFIQNYQSVTSNDEKQRESVSCLIKDMITLCRVIGREASEHLCLYFQQTLSSVHLVLQALFTLQSTIFQNIDSLRVSKDIILLGAEILGTFRAFSPWLFVYWTSTKQNGADNPEFLALLSGLFDLCVAMFTTSVPESISRSSSHFLLSLTSSGKLVCLLKLPSLSSFVSNVHSIMQPLSISVQIDVFLSMSDIIFMAKPSQSNSSQEWESVSNNFKHFVSNITHQYIQLSESSGLLQNYNNPNIVSIVTRTVRIMKSLLYHSKSSGKGKIENQILYQSLQPALSPTLKLAQIYVDAVQTQILTKMIELFCALLEVSPSSLEPGFLQQTFIFLFSVVNDQTLPTRLRPSEYVTLVVKFLKILSLIVEDTRSSFQTYLHGIVSFITNDAYPNLIENQSPHPDIKIHFHMLLYQLYLNHFWKNLSQTDQNADSEQQTILRLFEIWVSSLRDTEINVVSKNLEHFDNLNSKRKLFSRPVFLQYFYRSFLSSLFNTLLSKSQNILKEEMIKTIYSVASVDFQRYSQQFVIPFLCEEQKLNQEGQQHFGKLLTSDSDFPTFSLNLTDRKSVV